MRIDKEKTKTALKEKDAKLDAMMKELEDRGELQKKFEIEVDRLFRLKELKYRCMRVSPMRTLGEKEHGKIVNEAAPSSQSQSQSEFSFSSMNELMRRNWRLTNVGNGEFFLA
ncbi:high mobility group B protein 6 isoform X2 [Arachis ipaensis]|uniref:high mobility group B protein 6 isoform X2 n=1 Tax=Arachis ipaensis TaxID=130454 RepID=UPI000A2B3EE5|nr:high mobility group B protein 6 isoform X2 [Arachis ipaensis]XP_025657011.1 high mobility group B protein 6 isoform X2 [Arachis hypogaea]XP_025657014.1 high mobility group B protein 6 isoform X2 [Arachis hypogaea]